MTRRHRVLVGALVLALVASLVVLALVWREWSQLQDRAAAEDAAERAARQAVLAMTTYDHETLEQDFAWVERVGTEDFEEFFRRSSKRARTYIEKVEASATGEVVASAADVQGPDRVEVLLFVTQTITRAGAGDKRVDRPRVTMTMVRVDGEWLVDHVELSGALTR